MQKDTLGRLGSSSSIPTDEDTRERHVNPCPHCSHPPKPTVIRTYLARQEPYKTPRQATQGTQHTTQEPSGLPDIDAWTEKNSRHRSGSSLTQISRNRLLQRQTFSTAELIKMSNTKEATPPTPKFTHSDSQWKETRKERERHQHTNRVRPSSNIFSRDHRRSSWWDPQMPTALPKAGLLPWVSHAVLACWSHVFELLLSSVVKTGFLEVDAPGCPFVFTSTFRADSPFSTLR